MQFTKSAQIIRFYINEGEYLDAQDFRHALQLSLILLDAAATIEAEQVKFLKECLKKGEKP